MLHWYTFVLLIVGFLVGGYSSVAGGGAIVLIPLFTLFGISLPSAIATVRLSSVLQQGISVIAFAQKGAVRWKPALWSGAWMLPGSYLGAKLVLQINERLLMQIVILIMSALLVMAFLFDRKKVKKVKKKRKEKVRWGMLALVSIVLGVYGGFYGAGVATLLMMAFIFLADEAFLVGSGNSSIATLGMSIVASYVFLQNGLVSWEIWWPITIGGVIGSWVGVESAVKFGSGWIKASMVLVIVLAIARFAL